MVLNIWSLLTILFCLNIISISKIIKVFSWLFCSIDHVISFFKQQIHNVKEEMYLKFRHWCKRVPFRDSFDPSNAQKIYKHLPSLFSKIFRKTYILFYLSMINKRLFVLKLLRLNFESVFSILLKILHTLPWAFFFSLDYAT